MATKLKKPDGLNEQQLAVVNWILKGEGSLNLIARAGCGKTYTLVRGAVRAIVENRRGTLALMAFNKDAAREFDSRIVQLADELGNPSIRNPLKVARGTVHSFGFKALRKIADGKQEVDGDKVKRIVRFLSENDEDVYAREGAAIVKLVSLAKQMAFGVWSYPEIENSEAWFEVGEYHGVFDSVEADPYEVIEAAQVAILRSKRSNHKLVDFDDMVWGPLVHNLQLPTYDWVLIDEAQDTNPSRRELALRMMKPKGRLIAVGDDRQAIYGFTGADANALDLIREALDSEVLPLSITYRCPKTVVTEANRLVPDLTAHESAPEGSVRTLGRVVRAEERPEGAPATDVPWYLSESRSARLTRADAILCRNTAPLVQTAYALLREGIPCRIRGREIGEGLIKLALKWKTVRSLPALLTRLDSYREKQVEKWRAKDRPEKIQRVEDEVEALKVIAESLMEKGRTDVQDLVAWVKELFADDMNGVLTLSTIHKAKGREWPRVYLLYRNETLPSAYAEKDWQQLQEANLEYVAITRAKEDLVYVD